jgi:serine/threonine protein kinase
LTWLAGTDDPSLVGSDPRAGTASTRYEILGRLAEGGMAEIFLAKSVGMAGFERHVVLKRVLPERARDQGFVAMFLDEARLAAQLHHPNIAQVYDIGKLGDSYFFTMEYVHGENVRELLGRLATQRRQLAIGDALTIIGGAAAGLHHAHERKGTDRKPLGIVHRDVSPSNLIVSYEGSVKVVDFGIAKANLRNAADTRTGSVKGKVAYMSPEQCKGKELDRRSDVFALGIVLWELCTGQRLFKYETDFDTMSAIVYQDPPAPSHLRPGVPAEVDRIVATALAKDPARRFATAQEMLEAIETASVRTGHPMSTTALGRTIRSVCGERPEPWVLLREESPAQAPITVTGEAFDIELPDVGELAVRDSAIIAAVGAGGATNVTQTPPAMMAPHPAPPTKPLQSVDELLRRTNPIPRGTSQALRDAAAAAYAGVAAGSGESPPPAASASGSDPHPATTLPLPPAFSPASVPPQVRNAPASQPPHDRIATRRGHVPAHRAAAARARVAGGTGGTGGTGTGSRPSQPILPSGAYGQIDSEVVPRSASPAAARDSSVSATADILSASKRRAWGPVMLIVAIVLALGGLALAYALT